MSLQSSAPPASVVESSADEGGVVENSCLYSSDTSEVGH